MSQTPNQPVQPSAPEPVEMEAVKTTIVGGRPPGSGKHVGEIPRGIEVLIKKAAVDTGFKALLLARRSGAAGEIGLVLQPSEAAMIDAVPAGQLEAIIARTKVDSRILPAFLGKVAAVMLVALGASASGDAERTAGVRAETAPATAAAVQAQLTGVAGMVAQPGPAPVGPPQGVVVFGLVAPPSTMPATRPTTQPVSQPTTQASRPAGELRVVVRPGVNKMSVIYVFRGKEYDDPAKLLEALKAEKDKTAQVVIEAAAEASTQKVIDLFDRIKKAGFDNIVYGASNNPPPPPPIPPDQVRPVRGITVLGIMPPVAGVQAR
jgi:biopolymer transport protein ExbD